MERWTQVKLIGRYKNGYQSSMNCSLTWAVQPKLRKTILVPTQQFGSFYTHLFVFPWHGPCDMVHIIWWFLVMHTKMEKTEVHPVRGTEEFLIKVTSRWARVTLPIQTLFSVVTFENTYRYNAANYVIQSSFLQSVLQHRAMLHNWFIVWVKEFTYYITEVKCN